MTARISQAAQINLISESPGNARVSQAAQVNVVREIAGNARISQLVMIRVISDRTDYIRLRNPVKLPCWQPCTAYGTHATIVIFN